MEKNHNRLINEVGMVGEWNTCSNSTESLTGSGSEVSPVVRWVCFLSNGLEFDSWSYASRKKFLVNSLVVAQMACL